MDPVTFNGNRLFVGAEQIASFDYPINEAFASAGIIVVFLDPKSHPDRSKSFNNLLGVNAQGQTIWTAELPRQNPNIVDPGLVTRGAADVFWRLGSKNPLIVSSFSSFDIEIDPRSGKVLAWEFYK